MKRVLFVVLLLIAGAVVGYNLRAHEPEICTPPDCPYPNLELSLEECERTANSFMYEAKREWNRLNECRARMSELAVQCGLMSPQE